MKKTVYLIDGTAYIHRAYHAIRELTNSAGLPTNAIFGFTRMLIKLMEDRKPAYAGMVFDAKGPTFRHEMYHDYKANRPPMPQDMAVQIPYIKQVTAVPYTISGKKVEIAVTRMIHGEPVANRDALANPEALDQYAGIV